MTETYLTQPIDQQSARVLADAGLRLSLVDTADQAAFDQWLLADFRGFLGGRNDADALAEAREYLRDNRTTAVYDDAIPAAASPVGTVNSWVAP
ncbi:MAG TPA: GNAT family N-acetyltransferase, partial [Diaminobutyricibacter sp.]